MELKGIGKEIFAGKPAHPCDKGIKKISGRKRVNKSEINIHAGLILLLIFCSLGVSGQCQKGRILSSETRSGIGFASVGIVGKNVGTVSDREGNFTLDIDEIYDGDSLRFSMIGYYPKSVKVSQFRQNPQKDIFLIPLSYVLKEVKVVYNKPVKKRLGNPVSDDFVRSGFGCNDLGSELGIEVHAKRRVKLKDINLNVSKCTYDSVTYRVNIYRVSSDACYENILTKPIYISFTKDDINRTLSFDLSRYSIIVEGNILVALELYKDLGEGRLLFNTQYFTGSTFHRKTSEGTWTESPGVIGMYLNSNEIR
jgi:hypothetical protein